MVALNKRSRVAETVRKQLEVRHGKDAQIKYLSRGRIKGVNIASECTLAYTTSMATFTTIDDCALHAALTLERTYPDQPDVYTAGGEPNWPGGRFKIPAMRQYYALQSLDEIYQTVWRTAVRNDQPAEAIIAVPDPDWLGALWWTVMPHFNLGLAYRKTQERDIIVVGGRQIAYNFCFEEDDGIAGLRIICSPPGAEFEKKQIAGEFGYTGKQAWKSNKQRIMRLIAPFFEPSSTNRKLRRRHV